jgi:RNA polymerase sigma-70 factor (ECF subfamily)
LTIEKYIEKAKEGDQIAFTFLLNFYWNDVYHFILKRAENEEDSEDITIETFAKAFNKINTYNADFKFSTWLITIAKNVHVDLIRKTKSSLVISEYEDLRFLNVADETLSAEDSIIQDQSKTQLQYYIKALKPHYQKVIQLRFFEELSYQEIATAINEPLANVKIKLLRAKKLLATLIEAK